MNKEDIQKRLDTLVQEQAQVRASIAAYEGAIQDCKYWLEQLDKEPEPKTKKDK